MISMRGILARSPSSLARQRILQETFKICLRSLRSLRYQSVPRNQYGFWVSFSKGRMKPETGFHFFAAGVKMKPDDILSISPRQGQRA